MRRRRKKRERIPWEVRPTVAPGDLSLVQAFVNTVDRKVDNDELASPESLAAWLSHRWPRWVAPSLQHHRFSTIASPHPRAHPRAAAFSSHLGARPGSGQEPCA